MSSTTRSVCAASDSGMGSAQIPKGYSIRDHDLQQGTDAGELGVSMTTDAAHPTWPVRALPPREDHSPSAAPGRPLKTTPCPCSDGDPGGEPPYP